MSNSVGVSAPIDLKFRPASYFWPLGLEKHLLARVKGAQRKRALQDLIDAGRHDEIPNFLATSALSEEDRRMFGSIHPMCMGGEYLPDMEEDEVEIARISLHSTTGDVTSVYARRKPGGIALRVVDEYGGDTLTGETEREVKRPLTLNELTAFFMKAWPLFELLDMNYEGELERQLGFFWADSVFYPDFDRLLRRRACTAFRASRRAANAAERARAATKGASA
jgi:hypothetical protein